jgi:predicted RNA binding protein YcfA (HicA-like mRNA interferase family)
VKLSRVFFLSPEDSGSDTIPETIHGHEDVDVKLINEILKAAEISRDEWLSAST